VRTFSRLHFIDVADDDGMAATKAFGAQRKRSICPGKSGTHEVVVLNVGHPDDDVTSR
jgi:hypothetical protein